MAQRAAVPPLGLRAAALRNLAYARTRSQAPRNALQTAQRRGYTSGDAGAPKPKTRALRYLWRATYLSAIGGITYLGYSIYDSRHPHDQFEPDPSKKTLVILGKPKSSGFVQGLILIVNWGCYRQWMGKRVSAEKTGYLQLQCRCRISQEFLLVHSITTKLPNRNN